LTTESRITRIYDVKRTSFEIPEQPDLEGRNYPLVVAEMCKECHGPDFSGQVLEDDPLIGHLVSSNLTRGEGGIGSVYNNGGWYAAIRHGIRPDGKSLLAMPSKELNILSDHDLGIVISLIKNSPPIDKTLPKSQLGLMGRVILLQGAPILSAEQIEGSPAPPTPPEPGETVEYGQYLAALCAICHGEGLAGVDEPGGGTNLTPGGKLGTWTEEDFVKALRMGVEPDGKKIDQELMPTRIFGKLNESELKALWMYLQTLPEVVKPTATSTEQ
jgi:mono/diheme cytochrome c family protein